MSIHSEHDSKRRDGVPSSIARPLSSGRTYSTASLGVICSMTSLDTSAADVPPPSRYLGSAWAMNTLWKLA